MATKQLDYITIPLDHVGPIKIIGDEFSDEVTVPLATFETPIWPSTNRGAKISRLCGGISATIIDDHMTRSILIEAPSAIRAHQITKELNDHTTTISNIVTTTSNFAKLKNLSTQVVGNLIYLRFEFTTGEASGHNMATIASNAVLEWLLKEFNDLQHISISANFCTDKKVSAANSILGRGKYVVADITIPRAICEKHLRTTPDKIVDLNIKKNLIGSTIAGSLCSANAHFANMLLAIYLATGQDCANIVEGSQGITHTQVKNGDLYFSVTLPNIIVGTVGNGKELNFVKENLKTLGCNNNNVFTNSRRLAIIVAATVLCGELSLMAALTNPGELTRSHKILERGKKCKK